MPRRKAIPSGEHRRSGELFFSEERWGRILSHIPKPLSPEAAVRLRGDIEKGCSRLLIQRRQLEERVKTTIAMQSPGKRQPSPLERFAKGLRMAADAWEEIEEIYDDRLRDIRRFDDLCDGLEALARDAERRLAGIRALGEPVKIDSPWPRFVRKIYKSCDEAGLKPTTTGRVYVSSIFGRRLGGPRPTWFHQFMLALNNELLGDIGKGKISEHMRSAFYAEITNAVSGGAKRGKARK